MAWIESHQTLARHPKTMRASQALGITRVQLIGHLHMLWWWCLDYALDGALMGISDAEIAAAAEWDGDAEAFALALTRAGFLEADDAGTLHIHDWYEYAEKYIERREANAQRMREARASKEKPRATHVQRTLPARAGATIPNLTTPNLTKEETTPNGVADEPPAVLSERQIKHRAIYGALTAAFGEPTPGPEKARYETAAKQLVTAGCDPSEIPHLIEAWTWINPGEARVNSLAGNLTPLRKARPPTANGRASPNGHPSVDRAPTAIRTDLKVRYRSDE